MDRESKGVGKGGSEGSDDPPPPFLGTNLTHFLYKVLGKRLVQKETFSEIAFKTTPLEKFLPTPLDGPWLYEAGLS